MKIGIVISNIGTPDAPEPAAVKKYLAEFLSDKRVVRLARIFWLPILYGYILRTRPAQSAKLYQKIWTEQGSPQLVIMMKLARKLELALRAKLADTIYVKVGMRYGNPSISAALEELRSLQVDRILVFPLYPQYSTTTTLSTRDAVQAAIKNWQNKLPVGMINAYASNPSYIHAIAQSIKNYWRQNGKRFLLFSFHGIPQRYVNKGETYADSCKVSAEFIAQELNLHASEWTCSFQSRLGAAKWLTPYTDKVLAELPKKGIEHIHVVCPGFAVDCLETLEEIAIRGREQFLQEGGKKLEYVPALNAGELQVELLSEIIFNISRSVEA